MPRACTALTGLPVSYTPHLSLRDLFLPFTGIVAPLNESVYALIYAKLNQRLGSGESFPKEKLLSFPSETGHNITFTTFFLK